MSRHLRKAKMASRAQRSSNTINIIIFVILVAISGYGLALTGNFDNPFHIFAQAEPDGEGRSQFNRETGGEQPAGEVSDQGLRGSQETLAWSNIGDVLFNLWFLFAVAAFIIVIQYPLR